MQVTQPKTTQQTKRSFKKMLTTSLLLLGCMASASAQDIDAIAAAQEVNPTIQYVNKLDKTVRSKNLIVGTLTVQQLNKLPIGIMSRDGKAMICIDSAKFGPNGATFNAYAAIQLPNWKRKLCFRALNVSFGPNGISMNNATLVLVSNHVLSKKNYDVLVPGNGNNNIQFDCNGFKELNLEGQCIFKPGKIYPDVVEAPGATKVTATLRFEHVVNLNNLLASISITPFKIRGFDDFAFKVTDATADFSDYNNPAGFTFPTVYQNEYGQDINLWRGFFLRNITIRTPFNKTNGGAKISATNMLIDEHGISGLFAATNLVDINESNSSKWVFSVDTLQAELLRSRLMAASISGGMRVPFLGDDSIGYRGYMSQWNDELEYGLKITLRENAEFGSKMGEGLKVKLRTGSFVELTKDSLGFQAAALLHGSISSNNGAAKFQGITFENVGLSTNSPYIHSGIFSLVGAGGTTPDLGGFKLSISNIGFGIYDHKAALAFKAGINFGDTSDRSFGADASFRLFANIVDQPAPSRKQTWEFGGIRVDTLHIHADAGSFEIDGQAVFFQNDLSYGNGFKGTVSLRLLKNSLNLQAAAGCYFGKKDNLKYWQVSAYVSADDWGVPIVPGVIYMNGFMGGVSYHMKKPNRFMITPNMMDTVNYQPISDPAKWVRDTYVPDANSGIGIMIGTSLYAVKAKLLSASVALEIGLNENWGLNYIQFNGYATIFKDMRAIQPVKIVKNEYQSEAAFTATVSILYDRPNKTFHANVSAYLDLIVLRGAGPQNLLGELVIHADPVNWYIYVGRPSSPVGAKFALGNLDMATLQTYFMVGTVMEPFPAPPSQITSVINYTPPVSAAQLRTGGGVAFGARFSAGAGIDFGWLYAGIWFGAGGDIMLSTTGNATCDGQAAGFNGWWARGQVYAWLQGGVGIRVRVFKKLRDFKILELSAAVLLEAKVPKPSWFRGHVGVRWSLLGGLIKGNISMSVKIGKECSVMTNTDIAPEQQAIGNDMIAKVMSGVYPNKAQTGVDIYATPTVLTNIPIDSVFSQLDDLGEERNYKITMNTFRVSNGAEDIAGTLVYNQNKKQCFFLPTKKLLPDMTYQIGISLGYRKQLNGGYWTVATDADGNAAHEDTVFTFKTGPPSDVLSFADLSYSYPFNEMKNFYKGEYAPGGGYIQTGSHVNFDNVFYPGTPGSGISYTYKFRLQSVSPGDSYATNYQPINRTGNRFTFGLPNIQNNKVYRLSIVRIANEGSSNSGNGGVESNVDNGQVIHSVGYGADSSMAFNDTTVNNVLTGPVSRKETEVLGYNFRVSKYNTFSEKMNSLMAVAENQQDLAEGNVVIVATKNNMQGELFDEFEMDDPYTNPVSYGDEDMIAINNQQLGGGSSGRRLVRIVADSVNDWLQQDIYPIVYPNSTGATGGESHYRNIASGGGSGSYTGIPPLSKVTVEHSPKPLIPNAADAYERLMTPVSQPGATKMMLKYNLPYFANKDYQVMYIRALADWITAPLADKTVHFSQMVQSGGVFPQIRTGSYMIHFTYYLPGTNTPSSEKQLPVIYQ
jgi:hypothetical protein